MNNEKTNNNDFTAANEFGSKITNGAGKIYYTFTDNLGSLNLLVNTDGTFASDLSYDAWGRRRNAQDWTYDNISPSAITERGYCLHEHLDAFNLINMNGRAYDPLLGQFLSPDPFVQDPANTQSFNRYSYCLNNPLKYIDPTGYFPLYYDWLREQGYEDTPENRLQYQHIRGMDWAGTLSDEFFGPNIGSTGAILANNTKLDFEKMIKEASNLFRKMYYRDLPPEMPTPSDMITLNLPPVLIEDVTTVTWKQIDFILKGLGWDKGVKSERNTLQTIQDIGTGTNLFSAYVGAVYGSIRKSKSENFAIKTLFGTRQWVKYKSVAKTIEIGGWTLLGATAVLEGILYLHGDQSEIKTLTNIGVSLIGTRIGGVGGFVIGTSYFALDAIGAFDSPISIKHYNPYSLAMPDNTIVARPK